MLAKRTDEVLGKLVALIDISADLAYKALFAFRLRPRFNILLIVGVCHSLGIGNNSRLGNRADKHSVSVKINILLNLQGHERVDISRQKSKSVIRTQRFTALKFVYISAAPESEILKHGKRGVN